MTSHAMKLFPVPFSRCSNRFRGESARRIHGLVILLAVGLGLPAAAASRGFFLTFPEIEVNEYGASPLLLVGRCCGPELPPASVELVSSDGSATAGLDSLPVSVRLNFALGQTNQFVPFSVLDDARAEGRDAFTLTLRNPTEGTPLDAEHSTRVFLRDDELGFRFDRDSTSAAAVVSEDATVLLLFVLRGANQGGTNQGPEATVEVVTSDDTAQAGLDYVSVTTNLTFRAGENQQVALIPLLNDALIEGDEFFTVRLRNSKGWPLDTDSTWTELRIRLRDNDRGFVARGVAPTYGVTREDAAWAKFEIALVGDAELTESSSVRVSTQDGTAKAGFDYEATNARLVFAPGERVKSFTVPILNDRLLEGDEQFFVQLSQPAGAPVSYLPEEARTWAGIEDNELGYRFETFSQRLVFREGEIASVTLRRVGDFDVASTVRLSLLADPGDDSAIGGAATPELDFPTLGIEVTFGPGETRKVVNFALPDDGVAEPEEELLFSLEAVSGGVPVQLVGATWGYIVDSRVLPALVDPDFDLVVPAQGIHRFNGDPLRVVAQADGKLVYVVDRSGYDGHFGNAMVRVLADGRLDPTWSPLLTRNYISALAAGPQGTLIVALDPFGEEDVQEHQLLRLSPDGTRNVGYRPITEPSPIRSLRVSPDGRVLVFYSESLTLGRFLENGNTDPSFHPPALDETPTTILFDDFGRILIGGSAGLTRWRADGSRDDTFTPPLQSDGVTYRNVRSVLTLTNGQLLMSAWSDMEGSRVLVRVNPSGTSDAEFPPRRTGDYAELLQTPDGTPWFYASTPDPSVMGGRLERLLPGGGLDPAGSPLQIVISQPRIRGELDPFRAQVLQFLPGGDALLLSRYPVNGQPRQGATKLLLHPGLQVVVDPNTARIPENAGDAELRLLRSGPTAEPLTLGWSTEPITAVPGRDYTAVNGTITFPVGRRTATITVPVLDNDLPDRDRLVRLRFTGESGRPVPPPAGFAIANDDLGFPPDGIRALADGQVLLRPTGWLDGWVHVESGVLEEFRLGVFSWRYSFHEPYPEFIVDAQEEAFFFRVIDPNPRP
jgi:hypothetical protein